ncbi:hypothetical protein Tco_0491080 [Tanacetum coccineum]
MIDQSSFAETPPMEMEEPPFRDGAAIDFGGMWKFKKLEIEAVEPKDQGNDVPAYPERSKNNPDIVPSFLANETEKVDKYISGLPDNIYGNVKSARPKTLDETIELANDLMDQKLRTYAERQSDNKRRPDDINQKQPVTQQQPFTRKNVASLQYGDRRKEALWGIFAQMHQVPSSPQWPVHPEVPQVQQNRALCSRLQEYW